MYAHGLLAPVLALAAWTFVMWVWMYALRIPAMRKARTDLREAERTGVLDLPRAAQRPAENYNHLHEQPTVFYAVALAAQIGGAADTITAEPAAITRRTILGGNMTKGRRWPTQAGRRGCD